MISIFIRYEPRLTIPKQPTPSNTVLSVTMAKEEGAKMVVVGGKNGVEQRYCGTVGGESTDFSEIDTIVKVCPNTNSLSLILGN